MAKCPHCNTNLLPNKHPKASKYILKDKIICYKCGYVSYIADKIIKKCKINPERFGKQEVVLDETKESESHDTGDFV